MEPLHKDAETAAAAAAVAAADPRGASSSSGVVVQVREKKGPLRAAIPYMPFPVAVICLFLNTFVPGLGKKWRGWGLGGGGDPRGPLNHCRPCDLLCLMENGDKVGIGPWLRPVGVPTSLRLCSPQLVSGRWLKPVEWASRRRYQVRVSDQQGVAR